MLGGLEFPTGNHVLGEQGAACFIFLMPPAAAPLQRSADARVMTMSTGGRRQDSKRNKQTYLVCLSCLQSLYGIPADLGCVSCIYEVGPTGVHR